MSAPYDRLVRDARAIFSAGVRAVQAPALVARFDPVAVLGAPLDADRFHRVLVLGAGKAAMAMAGALEARFPGVAFEGEVAVPHGYLDTFRDDLPIPRQIGVRTAGHPYPDASSVEAGRRALMLASQASARDLVVVLLSGGGSALWSVPVSGFGLGFVQTLTRRLLTSGAPISEVNAVRRAFSAVAGGRLAAAAHPARVLALVVSDVVGDRLEDVASGPTVGEPRDGVDAGAVLRSYGLWEHLSSAARGLLADPTKNPVPAGDPRLAATTTLLLGSNELALKGALAEAEKRGYAGRIVTRTMEGEARSVGGAHAGALMEVPPGERRVLLWGGETTVTVRGDGVGGRNQEAALAAALALAETDRPCVLLCGGTDGIDGPTDAAGGWATPSVDARGREMGLEARSHLERNDALSYLTEVGALLVTGPTHTNVMDLHVGVVLP